MNQALEPVDLLIEVRWVIPVEPAGLTLENHAVAVRDERIVALLPISDARLRFNPAEIVSLDEHVLIPGLINLHTHTAMALMRGIADDMPLMRWLSEAIWPAERAHVSERFVFEGTLVGGAEMLKGGITTACDMYFFPDAAARAYDQLGMRAVVGMTVIDFPNNYAADAADHLHKGLLARDAWRDHARISFALAPHAPYTVSNESFERVMSLAEELDALIHIHVHETRDEIAQSVATHGVRPLQRLKSLGLLGPNLLIAHGVHLEEEEIGWLAENGVGMAHNPISNMKLGSGIAPVARLLEAGIAVGLGTDGAASNNRLDILQEMRMAALLAKVHAEDPTPLPAHTVLRMATYEAARALGQTHRIGSIEAGKFADLAAIKLDNADSLPVFDPLSHLVYVAGREHVTDTWVGGRHVVNQRQLIQNQDCELLRISRLWQNSIQK